MDKKVLAIDGGGTKTAALVADSEGNVRELVSAAGCNPQDRQDWKASLHAVLAQASEVEFTVVGMPGFGEVPEHDEMVIDFISAEIGSRHLIVNDVELAFYGAHAGRDGILILAGTGSMAIGGEEGVMRRAGGWGHFVGDEGSAYWIGQQALALAAQELDGRCPAVGFASRLGEKLGAPSHRFGLLDWVMAVANTRAQIASVARTVDLLDQSNDVTAGHILDSAATHLVALSRAVSNHSPPWCHSGSVFNSKRITEAVTRELGPPVKPIATALVGGLHRAATLAHWPVTSSWIARISA